MSSGSINNMLLVSIESQKFPGSYLRIDGRDVSTFSGPGSGIVNCQNYAGTYETLAIINHPEDNTFSILSSVFPGVYLRMDGHDVQSGGSHPKGAGKVNCQYGSRTFEKFRFEELDDGSKAIASVRFPNVYLRMENDKIEGGPGGAGTVNCQSYIDSYEKFKIQVR